MIPLVALVGMWALATYVTIIPGLDLLRGQVSLDSIGRPGGVLLEQVQVERRASIMYLAAPKKDATELVAQRARTDAAIREFRGRAGSQDTLNGSSDTTVARLTELFRLLDAIGGVRGTVDRGDVDRGGAYNGYAAITDSLYQVYSTLTTTADADLSRDGSSIASLGRAREILSREDAVISGALAAGSFNPTDLSQAVQLIGAQRFLYADTAPKLYPTDRDDYSQVLATAPFSQLTLLENRVLTEARAGAKPPIDAAAWNTSYGQATKQLSEFELRISANLLERSKPTALTIFGRIAVAGLLGLIAFVITLVASIRIGRSLIKRLAGLRQAALELAVDRLPRVVTRLRHGEDVDVANEAPPLPYGDDEIGQVGHAFNELQRTAVNSAIEEANVRRGLNEVFLNIARRSQTLLHRQLSILDRMERRTDDPAELEDLFRVDHLATRMRRHAEDLVILAGSAPGRGWRNPVPIVDVLRGAVSEVEDYARVSIRPMPEVALIGPAVGDVIHLLAELIENATSFSPPHTRVNIGGERVAHGFAVEIEDRGLGMSSEAIGEANHRLANPPDFDPANSAQLGLFVVARLAARHGVKVQLRSSAYGGVTAVALLPEDLVVAGTDELTSRPTMPRQREPLAVLPRVPQADAGPRNGSTRGTLYRELSTAQRPAIGASTVAPITAEAAVTMEQPITVDQAPDLIDAVEPATPETAVPKHARQEIIEAPLADGSDGLPRRVRQTSIAPQLREEPPADGPQPGAGSRSPEDLRAMMSSFQAGMNRGRRDADLADAAIGDADVAGHGDSESGDLAGHGDSESSDVAARGDSESSDVAARGDSDSIDNSARTDAEPGSPERDAQ